MNSIDRRRFLSAIAAAGALGSAAAQSPGASDASAASIAIPGKRPMLLHNDRPEDLETPSAYFNTWITPNDAFFVRQHLPRPSVRAEAYRLKVSPRVSNPRDFPLAALRQMPQHKVAATLECTGNGRGFYRPRVPGIQWGRGAIGNAEWSGPRIQDILKLCGAEPSAGFLDADGADTGVAATPDFIRSLPMRKALHPATLLALDMNGEPLPEIHGFPARLIVPGWDGTSWVKWVTSLAVASEQNEGFFMNPAYRYPKIPLPPGSAPVPAELEVIEAMRLKSSIVSHADGDKVGMGQQAIRGFAWAAEERVARVDVSTDGGSRWLAADLSTQNFPFAWRLWKANWTPPGPGYYTILSRATDSNGKVQPMVASWNPSGYLWDAIDRVGIVVEKNA